MTDSLYDQINHNTTSSGISKFEMLTKNIENQIITKVREQPLAYVESNFFGGNGGHIGIIWKNQSMQLITDFHLDSMNYILRKLGVISYGNMDEFDTLGLGKHRRIDDWIS